MNPKKIKIILYIPLALFFIANLFYYPLPAQAEQICCHSFNRGDIKECKVMDKLMCEEKQNTNENPNITITLTTDPDACQKECDTEETAPLINDTMPNWKIPDIKLQIDIPGLILTKGADIKCTEENGKKTCSFPWIGEYIAGIYKYAIGIVGILAAVVLMIGGVVWITAGGNASRIGEAKAWIAASLSGLVIALCSYTILYYVNPNLVKFSPLEIKMVQKLEELTAQYESKSCLTLSEEEKSNGFSALVTGYCRPTTTTNYGDNTAARKSFLCNIGLNCSCPAGRNSGTNDCCNSKNFCWSSCKDFDDKNILYCNKTAAGGEPGVGQIAADWSCFPKNSNVCIGGVNYKVTDKGSAIKGTRFDVWTDDCSQAYNLTGVYNANLGSCK